MFSRFQFLADNDEVLSIFLLRTDFDTLEHSFSDPRSPGAYPPYSIAIPTQSVLRVMRTGRPYL